MSALPLLLKYIRCAVASLHFQTFTRNASVQSRIFLASHDAFRRRRFHSGTQKNARRVSLFHLWETTRVVAYASEAHLARYLLVQK